MTLQQLRYLVAVARERHFGQAAEKCFVSQPSLSVAVKNLEEELGVAVFERTRQEAVLTAAGARIVAQAERALEEAAHVAAIAAGSRDQLAGPLHLGVIHTVAPYLLPDLVAALRVRAPAMPLDLEENQTLQLERMLLDGDLDAALLAAPVALPGCEAFAVYEEQFEIIVPARHGWAKRRQIPAEELEQENLLLLSAGHCLRDQILSACGRLSHREDSRKQGNSLETLRAMVASGIGITVMPATALTARYASPLLKRVRFSAPVPQRRILLVARRGFWRPRALQLVADTVKSLSLPIRPISD